MSEARTEDPPPSFSARRVSTPLRWDDLVLPADVLSALEDIVSWMRHTKTISEDWGFGRFTKPGYRALFTGPSGTGKTLAATLLGQRLEVPVHGVDLPMVVSRYIGETEKNLSRLFDRAQKESAILFFDEADALFGKRTEVSDAHDRYANQEVSYLLQRIEEFDGLVILATSLPEALDSALVRRFQSVISFPPPDVDLRLLLWRGVFPDAGRLASDVDLEEIARAYELTGGAIVEAARFGAIRAVSGGDGRVTRRALLDGVRKELRKARRSD